MVKGEMEESRPTPVATAVQGRIAEDTGEVITLDYVGKGAMARQVSRDPVLTKVGKRGIVPGSSIHFQKQAQILVHLPSWPEVSLLVLVLADCPQHLLTTPTARCPPQFGLTVGAPSPAFPLRCFSQHPHGTALMTC